jgi:hypothetical protein
MSVAGNELRTRSHPHPVSPFEKTRTISKLIEQTKTSTSWVGSRRLTKYSSHFLLAGRIRGVLSVSDITGARG